MNMLRQMMAQAQMQQGMGGMGGMGQAYNPYLNRFNPWAVRMRMQQLRRQFMQRQLQRQRTMGQGRR